MSALPPEFRQIRLELARERGHPEGSRLTGYELIVPLDAADRLSPEAWRQHRELCRVRRFVEGEEDRVGRLARHPGGSWFIDYDPDRKDDDQPGHRLGDEPFAPGEYVSIEDEHHHLHTYRVVAVRPA